MLALSDSSTMSDCSCSTVSPGLTRTSITSTASKSPISGTLTSITLMFAPQCAPACVASGRAVVVGCRCAGGAGLVQPYGMDFNRASRTLVELDAGIDTNACDVGGIQAGLVVDRMH